ncbi:MAG: PAS domain S-box protein [Magnetococcus sp. YQC-5]
MGKIRDIISMLKNVSYYKQLESKLDQANRALRSRKRFAEILATATHEKQTLEQMCQVLVQEAGYCLAWVGWVEEGEQQRLIPMAQYGFDTDYLQQLHLTLANAPPGNGSMEKVFQTGTAFLVHNLHKNSDSCPWQKMAKKKGYTSRIAIPMKMRGKPCGVLNLYTLQPGRFDSFEIECLSDLANQMAEGIARLRETANHYRMEQAIKEIEFRFRDVFNVMDRGLMVYDVFNDGEDFILRSINKAATKIINVVAHTVIGRRVTEVFPQGRDFGLFTVLQQVHRTGEPTSHPTAYFKHNNQQGWLENFVYKLESGEIVTVCNDFTEQRRTENRLRLAHETLKNISDMVFWIRPDSSFTLVNHAARDCLGYSQTELLTLSITDLNPDYPPDAWRSHWEELKKKRTIVFESIMHRKQAPPLQVEISANYVEFENNEYNVAIVRDISLRKQSENALLQSEQLLRDLYENAPVAFLSIDVTSGRIVRCNAATRELFGYDCEEMQQISIYDLYSDRYREHFMNKDVLQLLNINACVRDQVVMLTRKDGSIIWGSISLSPKTDAQGRVVESRMTIVDQTKRWNAEISLRQYAAIVSASKDLMAFIDKNFVYRAVNKAYLLNHCRQEQEIVGHAVKDLHGIDLFAQLRPRLDRCLQGESINYQAWFVFPVLGQRWMDVSYYPHLEDGQVEGIVVVSHDITELKLMDEELRRSEEQARQASLVKGEFMANMSHEIRTPLNSIIGMGYLILKTELSKQQRDYMEKILGASQTLLHIINDILDFSKSESGQMSLDPVIFHTNEIFDYIADLFGGQVAAKDVEIIFSISGQFCHTLYGDYRRLMQVITNLVHNAIKFTDQGIIEIAMHFNEIQSGKNSLEFFVRDTGIGIHEEHIKKLFDPFVQADSSTTRKYGGTGLGLSICKRLVELMGGTIWVESRVDTGSTFYFTVDFEYNTENADDAISIPVSMQNRRILVIDDSRLTWKGMEIVLYALNIHMTLVHSLPEAVKEVMTALHQGNPYHVVVIEWRTLEHQGTEFVRQMTGRHPAIPPPNIIPKIIIMTPHINDNSFINYQYAGASLFLQKPITYSHLIGSIMHMYGEHYPGVFQVSTATDEIVTAQHIGGKRILLVEDNDSNQQVAKELLERAKLVVAVACNGQEALEILNTHHFDAVLMDLEMPIMDGYVATRTIRKDSRFKTLPIIAMTAHAMNNVRRDCMNSGMNAFLSKPILPEHLYAELARWVGPIQKLDWSVNEVGEAPLLPDLSGVDMEKGLTHLSGNRRSYKNLLLRFYEEQRHVANEIQNALDCNNFPKAARLAHSIKGVAGTLGADALQQASDALEKAIQHGTALEQSNCVAAFDALLRPILDALALFMTTTPQSPTLELHEDSVSNKEQLTNLLTELAELLRDGISETDSLMERLKGHLQATKAAKAFQALQKHIYQYEFEKALDNVLGIAGLLKIQLKLNGWIVCFAMLQ